MSKISALVVSRRWIGTAVIAASLSIGLGVAGPAALAAPAAVVAAAGSPEAVVKKASDAIQQTLVAMQLVQEQ